jgi:ribosomal protein S12 methylthiotransferase
MKNVAIISLGCPKNLVDSEIMLSKLQNAGFNYVYDTENADIIIINTCTFIESATSESIEKILELIKIKSCRDVKIIAAGCMAQRYKQEIFAEIPETDCLVGTGCLDDIVEAASAPSGSSFIGNIDSDACFSSDRTVSGACSYTYLRIAEGCDKKCTYCIIPSFRGRYRSRRSEEIISEAKKLIDAGYREIILIAEDITYYGREKTDGGDLSHLLRQLDALEGDFSIRLLYCYPENIDDELISTIKNSKNIIRYLDIPIQHISDRILKVMNRKTDSCHIKSIIDRIRSEMDDAVIRTSVIVGFPGETEEEFEQLCRFINEYRLDHVGVFSYSREEGTPAYRLKDQVAGSVKEKRRKKLFEIQQMIVEDKNRQMTDRIYSACIDGVSDDGLFYKGRIYSQAPEIDPVTYILGLKELSVGDRVDIKIITSDGYDLIGEIVNEPSK